MKSKGTKSIYKLLATDGNRPYTCPILKTVCFFVLKLLGRKPFINVENHRLCVGSGEWRMPNILIPLVKIEMWMQYYRR